MMKIPMAMPKVAERMGTVGSDMEVGGGILRRDDVFRQSEKEGFRRN